MPKSQQSVIQQGLSEFFDVRKADEGAFITFEDGGGEHWFQYAGERTLNFDWPFGAGPDPEFERRYLALVAPVNLSIWEPDVYATYDVVSRDPVTIARVIDSVFHKVYELPDDYSVSWKIARP